MINLFLGLTMLGLGRLYMSLRKIAPGYEKMYPAWIVLLYVVCGCIMIFLAALGGS
jgi:hypothetical protein